MQVLQTRMTPPSFVLAAALLCGISPYFGTVSERITRFPMADTDCLLGIVQQPHSAGLDTSYVLSLYATSNPVQREFIDQLMFVYRRFANRRPDTTIARIGDIDGNGQIDTLWSRITLLADTVRVHSWWDCEGRRRWEYELIDPYLWISNDVELFQWRTNPWVTFAVGVFSAPASVRSLSSFTRTDRNRAATQGLRDLRSRGYDVPEEAYRKYLNSYQGMLVSFGHPESGEGLYIWYQPLEIFVIYYSP
jgi:hypothetical protein